MPACTVLSAGFSLHRKKFQYSVPEGLPYYLFRLQTEGTSSTLIGGSSAPMYAGDLLVICPGEPYQLIIEHSQRKPGLTASGDFFIFAEGPWLDAWRDRASRPSLQSVPADGAIAGLFRTLVQEQRRQSAYSADISASYLQILCMEIDRISEEAPPAHSSEAAARGMKQYIEEHAAGIVRLEEVAAHTGLSVSRAVRLFKEAYGLTIIQYANEVRLEMAKERMMYSPMPLEQVAETCGFANYTYFFRLFRRRYGVSPARYRESVR
ncbi:helix-turn-helix transcriptional regulator [Paenibacillus spiritus]|uniref:Helix-turn-helix transcriptional regulator n=1 Tax=Paenibacillus spiritus TaxID=2496557 RepID=A0A5J5G9G8_9BACL|nr:AraC family transcriptional regulator [Paenibacillus spiritus]KAA9004103.1 helix-turn-helix transcriptional regulator [Paenibacillus spiritus]